MLTTQDDVRAYRKVTVRTTKCTIHVTKQTGMRKHSPPFTKINNIFRIAKIRGIQY